MITKLRSQLVLSSLLIIYGVLNTVNAHHSHGNYQVQSLIEIQGVVTKFHLANPHVWIFMDVEDEKGNVANWAIEGGGVGSFTRNGHADIAPGDNLTLTCAPTRGGDNGCLVKEITINSSGEDGVLASNWTNLPFQEDFFRSIFQVSLRFVEKLTRQSTVQTCQQPFMNLAMERAYTR